MEAADIAGIIARAIGLVLFAWAYLSVANKAQRAGDRIRRLGGVL